MPTTQMQINHLESRQAEDRPETWEAHQEKDMKQILAIDGTPILIDDEDFEQLSAYRWRILKGKKGGIYAHTCKHRPVLMHRMLISVPQGKCIDHINGNGLDNRRSNLRVATLSQNQMNRGVQKNNKSGVKGVYFSQGKWRAQIKSNKRYLFIGTFSTRELAAAAYQKAAIELHGEFYSTGGVSRP